MVQVFVTKGEVRGKQTPAEALTPQSYNHTDIFTSDWFVVVAADSVSCSHVIKHKGASSSSVLPGKAGLPDSTLSSGSILKHLGPASEFK